MAEDRKLEGFLDFMEKLRNYEKYGVPKGAGTDSDDGFDLGRMRRLLHRLGNPHSNFKVVIGGPFAPHIERIIRDKASTMSSLVISACDPGIQYVVNCFGREDERPFQICDLLINVQKDMKLCIHLPTLKLGMLGDHQLQNAVTATCTALCLRHQGWKISDLAVRAGLESTQLPGRSQFLTTKEAEVLQLSKTSVLIDGAHTEASARGLADIIRTVHPYGPLVLVVAMASDKDHAAFATQLLSGRQPDIVLLTEVNIAGGRSRMTPATDLKASWTSAAINLGIDYIDMGIIDQENPVEVHTAQQVVSLDGKQLVLLASQTPSVEVLMKQANQLLDYRPGSQSGLIVVTGSLHIVSKILAALQR